jgi:hypothetical protein
MRVIKSHRYDRENTRVLLGQVEPYIGNALGYLVVTIEGKRWIATFTATSSPSSTRSACWAAREPEGG